MTRPLITIVIPVHNRASVVARTLDSVAAQTLRPLDVVLVDNASTDDTLHVLQDWADARRAPDLQIQVVSESRPGAAAARNAGLARVYTPWTMFFDSDDTMDPGHCERLARAIAEHPSADLVGWPVRLHDLRGKTHVKPFKDKKMLYNCILHGTMATQRYAARTDVFRGVGGWDPDVAVWNDIELGARIIDTPPHPRVVCLGGRPTVDVYMSADSITGTGYHPGAAGRELSLARIAANVREARRWVALRRAILAAAYCREGHGQDARRLLGQALAAASGARERLALRLAYRYTAAGARGAAAIFSHLI